MCGKNVQQTTFKTEASLKSGAGYCSKGAQKDSSSLCQNRGCNLPTNYRELEVALLASYTKAPSAKSKNMINSSRPFLVSLTNNSLSTTCIAAR